MRERRHTRRHLPREFTLCHADIQWVGPDGRRSPRKDSNMPVPQGHIDIVSFGAFETQSEDRRAGRQEAEETYYDGVLDGRYREHDFFYWTRSILTSDRVPRDGSGEDVRVREFLGTLPIRKRCESCRRACYVSRDFIAGFDSEASWMRVTRHRRS
jgi:hypothetical protein